jgi:hypothetical protein
MNGRVLGFAVALALSAPNAYDAAPARAATQAKGESLTRDFAEDKAGLAAELRDWLTRRRLERGGRKSARAMEENPVERAAVFTPRLGALRSRRRLILPPTEVERTRVGGVIRFERGPDGRIHHRYDFDEE